MFLGLNAVGLRVLEFKVEPAWICFLFYEGLHMSLVAGVERRECRLKKIFGINKKQLKPSGLDSKP